MTQNNTPKKNKFFEDILPLTIGEVLVVALVILGGLALSMGGVINFNAGIILGAILGAIVTIINYVVLIISLDKVISDYLALRGEKEMSEEEAEEFAKAHTARVQKAVSRSSVLRTLSIVACLLIAFITGIFNPVATIIPLLAYRPILTVIEVIRAKRQPAPNPENYIKYEDKEEKESD